LNRAAVDVTMWGVSEDVHSSNEPTEAPEIVEVLDGEEVVEGLPVLAEVHEISRVPVSPGLGAVRAAAAAATGFVAGAATLALARRYGSRRLEQRLRPTGGVSWPSTGTRTYIVRVRVLRPPFD
jgi:hypothetical protein